MRHWSGLSLAAAVLVWGTGAPGLAQGTLPPLSIEPQKTTKPAKKAAPKQKATTKQPADTAPPAVTAPPATETATGPVKDYVAKQSATATKTDTPLSETPQSISVAGVELVRDLGAQSLQESIRYMPGLVPDGFGFDTRGDYVLIRGIPATYFLDGMRTAYGYYANTAGAEPYSLERIEVLRGPSSMIYGQSSSGGLISMISKMPQEIRHGEITFDYGSFDFKQVKFDFGGPLTADGRWLYRLVGVARDAETQVDFVDNDRVFLMPSLTFRPSADTSITVMGTWRHDGGGSVQQFLPHAGTLKPNAQGDKISMSTFIGEPTDYNDTDQQSVTLLFDHKLAPGLTLHHGTRYTHTDNTYSTHYTAPLTAQLLGLVNAFYGTSYLPDKAPFLDASQKEIARIYLWRNTETDVLTSDTNLTGTFFTGAIAHKLTGGVDYTRYETGGASTPILVDNILSPGNFTGVTQSPFNIYNPVYGKNASYLVFGGLPIAASDVSTTIKDRPAETQTQTGIYIQDQIKLGRWSAILGLRKDWLTIEQGATAELEARPDVEQSALTGRAALMYHFPSGLSPYISYSQSFAAQPGNLVKDNPLDPNEQLRPALPLEGEQVEVGLRYQPPGMPFMISAALFDLKEKNRLVDDILSGFAQQGAEVRIKGFELEAIGKITENLKIIGAYTYNQGEYTGHFDPIEIGTSVEGLPRQTASLWGVYTITDGTWTGLSFGAGVRYIGESSDYGKLVTGQLGEVTTPSFTLFDAMVAYETKDWRWQLTGTNLEDEFHVVTCTTRGDCGVGQGRTVITSFTYKF